ncbi:nucleolar protein 12-like isoform X3 [Xenia sp. Carnegie-2017]|nr:nucleolar protein 12-like isoform X3 [Xenia sp. Carnegie-2017]
MRFVSWTDIMKRRKQKLVLVFDEENRKEFLTGFRKRKNARRKKALEENRVKIEENRRKLREEKQNSLKQHIQEYRENTETPSDNESLENEEDVLYDFGQHTVTVSTINCEGRAKDPLTYTPTVTSREKLEVDEDATAVQSNGKGIMDKLKERHSLEES